MNGDLVSGGFFQVLGLRAAHGRLFTPDDDRVPSGHPVVVLGTASSSAASAAIPSAVGRTVNINNHPMTIVGVAPRGFNGVEVGSAVDVYVPLAMQQELQPTWGKRLGDWRSRWLTLMARLKDGVSLAEAQAEANLVYAQLLQEDWAHIKGGSGELQGRASSRRRSRSCPGGRGTSGLRDQSGTPLAGADGHGRPGAADRVRERGEPAADARLVAPEGDRGAARARRGPPAPRAPAPRRERGARRSRAASSACSSRTGWGRR